MLRRSLAIVLTLVAVSGCHSVKVRETKGPDGSANWKRISCPHLDKRCFETARAICPNGYVFTKEGEGGKRMPTKAPNASSSHRGESGVDATPLPPQERWGSDMYSKKPGALIVRCEGARAS